MVVAARRLCTILVIVALSTPAWAREPCRQADIAGAWELYIGGGEVDGVWAGWSACRLTISRRRALSGPCLDDDGARTRISGGQLTVRETCRISGRLVVEDGTGAAFVLTIPRAALAASGDTITGVVRTRAGGFLGSALLQMVRM